AEHLPLVGGPAVTHPGLPDLDGADAGLDRPLGQVTVADDLLMARLVLQVRMGVDPGGDLGLDGLSQQRPGSSTQDVSQRIIAWGRWPHDRLGCRLIHGGVLLGYIGRLVVLRYTKVRRPPQLSIHNFWL